MDTVWIVSINDPTEGRMVTIAFNGNPSDDDIYNALRESSNAKDFGRLVAFFDKRRQRTIVHGDPISYGVSKLGVVEVAK
jgi:hypothetical protein